MTGPRPPDSVPVDVLNRPDFAVACARRDLGEVFRIAVQWGGIGFTPSHIARRCEMSVGRVQDYMKRGVHAQGVGVFERVADGLRIPGHMLGIARRPWESYDSMTAGDPESMTSQHDWLRTRRILNQRRREFTQLAAQLYPPSARLGQTGALIPDAWQLENPVDLASVTTTLDTEVPPPAVTGRHQETRALRPLLAPGRRYETYHQAIRDLDRPRLFENRVCYRLVDAKWSATSGRLALGHMRYFDMIDTGEAAAHELALAAIGDEGNIHGGRATWSNLPFRRLFRDPFELDAYPLLLSISTLTIRRSRSGTTFLMLRRHPGKVAIAGGMMSVFPTGVFQPASILPAGQPDCDLWQNMMREYSEEFLGNPEHDGNGDPIDYDRQEPFRSLNAARKAGAIRVWCLGASIDALNLVGDVLTVAVFDADVFDKIFHDLVDFNDEGAMASNGKSREQFDFDKPTITRLLADEPMAPSGAACLTLALQKRAAVLS